MKGVKTQIPNTINIDISGPKEQAEATLIKMKGKISELSGRLILEREFSDGFALMISFTDSNKKRLFEMEFGL